MWFAVVSYMHNQVMVTIHIYVPSTYPQQIIVQPHLLPVVFSSYKRMKLRVKSWLWLAVVP